MGEGADADHLDAGLGDGAHGLQIDAAGGFQGDLAVGHGHRALQGVGVEIVEHDDVGAVAQGLGQLVQAVDLDLDLGQVAGEGAGPAQRFAGWRVLAIAAWLLLYPVAMIMRRQPEDYGLHPDGKSDEEVRAGGGAAAAADYANSFTRSEALRTPALYLTVLAFGLSSVALGSVLMQAIRSLPMRGSTAARRR